MQPSFFDSERMTMRDALDLTRQSLLAYQANYRRWALAFSGGKDSSAALTLVMHLLESGAVPWPDSLTVEYADTRMELPPLHASAMAILAECEKRGAQTRVVLPPLDERFMVYMLGRGVPPPNNNTLRWCTAQIKVEPMGRALWELGVQHGYGRVVDDPKTGRAKYVGNGTGKLLMLTGVRTGESAARDQRITLSCSKNGAECGQGWFQTSLPTHLADTLAPMLHWRVCHVWDWLTLEAPALGFKTSLLAHVYGGDEAAEIGARTGCMGCPLVDEDNALDGLLVRPAYRYLAPLKRLKPIYRELRLFHNRLQKNAERNKGGELSANPMRKGPLTMKARLWALAEILDIQAQVNAGAGEQPTVCLINLEEEARIRELIAANTWPQRWDGTESNGAVMLHETSKDGTVQPVFFPGEVFA